MKLLDLWPNDKGCQSLNDLWPNWFWGQSQKDLWPNWFVHQLLYSIVMMCKDKDASWSQRQSKGSSSKHQLLDLCRDKDASWSQKQKWPVKHPMKLLPMMQCRKWTLFLLQLESWMIFQRQKQRKNDQCWHATDGASVHAQCMQVVCCVQMCMLSACKPFVVCNYA